MLSRLPEAPVSELPQWLETAAAGLGADSETLAVAVGATLRASAAAGELVAAAAALATHPVAAQALIAHLDVVADLGPEDARDALVALHAEPAARVPRLHALLLAAAPTTLVQARREAIARLVVEDPRLVAAVGSTAGDGPARELLDATLAGLRSTHAELERLGAVDGTEQLTRQRGRVTGAIDEALASAAGNDVLVEQLDAIRRAIESAGLPAEVESNEEARAFRMSLVERFPEFVQADDPDARISLSANPPVDVIGRIGSELGQLILSPRGVAAGVRSALEPDLSLVVDAIVDAVEKDPGKSLGRMPPEVEQRVWSRWAERTVTDARLELTGALLDIAGRDARSALMRVDALVAMQPLDGFDGVASELPADAVSAALSAVQRLLSFRRRRVEELQAKSAHADLTALEQLADRLARSLAAIDDLLAGYFRLREQLDAVGLERAEPALGAVRRRSEVDLHRHVVDSDADAYWVRTHGLRVRGGTVRQALLVPVDSPGDMDTPR